jgi:hypothetical protein
MEPRTRDKMLKIEPIKFLLSRLEQVVYYYYLLTAIGLMPGGSVYKGYTVNKEDDDVTIYVTVRY